MKKVILIMLFILAAGCKSGSEIEQSDVYIRDRVIKITPPVIIDSGFVYPEYIFPFKDSTKQDTILRYVKTDSAGKKTVDISVNTRTKKIDYTVQPPPVEHRLTDTLKKKTVTPAPVIETPLMSKIGIFSIGFLGAVLLIVALIIFYFARKKNATNAND